MIEDKTISISLSPRVVFVFRTKTVEAIERRIAA